MQRLQAIQYLISSRRSDGVCRQGKQGPTTAMFLLTKVTASHKKYIYNTYMGIAPFNIDFTAVA